MIKKERRIKMSLFSAGILCGECYRLKGDDEKSSRQKIRYRIEVLECLQKFRNAEVLVCLDEEDIVGVINLTDYLSRCCFFCQGDMPLVYEEIKKMLEQSEIKEGIERKLEVINFRKKIE